jgi:hypothetical protein
MARLLTRPPNGTPRRAIYPGEGLPISYTFLGGSGRGCPLLRASNEHSFTVRVLRARRAPGRSLLILLKPRVARAWGSSQLPHHLFQHPASPLDLMTRLLLRSPQADCDYTGRNHQLAIKPIPTKRIIEHGGSDSFSTCSRSFPADTISVGIWPRTSRFSRILEDRSEGADHLSRPFTWSLVGGLRTGWFNPRQRRSRPARPPVGH